jgi:hypothetical protein
MRWRWWHRALLAACIGTYVASVVGYTNLHRCYSRSSWRMWPMATASRVPWCYTRKAAFQSIGCVSQMAPCAHLPRCLNCTSYIDNHKLAKTTRCLRRRSSLQAPATLWPPPPGWPRSKALPQLTHAPNQVLRSHAINRLRPILALSTSTGSRRCSSNLSYACACD